MPVRPTYPGVYIEEIPSGVRTITGVATSVAAFIGTFRKGPLNEAMQIFSMADFEREYGGLERSSEASYVIQQFFLNSGSQAWVVRVADTETGAPPTAPPTNANTAEAVVESTPGDQIFRAHAGRRLRGESAQDPGTWGNHLRLEVDYETSAPNSLFNLTVSEVRIDGDRTTVLQTETYRNLTMEPDTANNALEVVNQGSRLIQLNRDSLAPANPPVPFVATFRPAASGTLSGALGGNVPAVVASVDDLEITITLDDGAGGTFAVGPLDVQFDFATTPTAYLGGSSPGDFSAWAQALERGIREAARHPVPSGGGVFPVAEQPFLAYLAGATVGIIGNGTVANPRRFQIKAGRAARPFDPTATLSFGGTDVAEYDLDGPSGAEVSGQQYGLAGGRDGGVTDVNGNVTVPEALFRGTRAAKTGLYALEDVDLFNILCIPQAARLTSADDMRTVYGEALNYAEERRSMALVDINVNVNRVDLIHTWLNDNGGLRHPNGAVYFPRTNVADPLNRNRPTSLASSGTIAGLWARTDTQRGVWKAPAGTDARLRNVQSLAYNLTDDENGSLNPLGVNCLRNFPVYSNICWGARTLEGADVLASDWKYIPVRRTTLFIEESLFRGTKWVVFEPNDEPLWAQIRMNVGAFMQDLFRKGAFQGTAPRDAYFVKCDGETTTQQDIDNGIVNIEVGFAPLRPAEFVILKIQQIARRTEV